MRKNMRNNLSTERRLFMGFEIQRASILKRISAFILDIILLMVVSSGAMLAISAITGYDGIANRYMDYDTEYAERYGLTADTEGEKPALSTIAEKYEELDNEEKQKFDEAWKAFSSDANVLHLYSLMRNLMILIPSLGIFMGYAVTDFIMPLILKNGQTVGKKVFGLGVIRCDGVKVNTFMLFVRTLIGKFTIETMIPAMMLLMNGVFGVTGIAVIGLLFVFEAVLLFATKNRTVIHDAFAQTVVVDLQSQMIFDSPEALLEYKERVAAEMAERADY